MTSTLPQDLQAAEYARHSREAERIKLEDDIRALQHWHDFGYLAHRVTRQRVASLIDALKGELSTIPSKDAT